LSKGKSDGHAMEANSPAGLNMNIRKMSKYASSEDEDESNSQESEEERTDRSGSSGGGQY